MNDGGPAFPRPLGFIPPIEPSQNGEWSPEQEGMSLRDYFAGQALQGYLAGEVDNDHSDPKPENVAALAYSYADAMLVARQKGS